MSETRNEMGKVVFQCICSIMLNRCDHNRQIVKKQLIDFIKDVTLEMGHGMKKKFSQKGLTEHFEKFMI